MKKNFELYRGGYVANYLVTRPHITDFEAPYTLKDQLQFEHEMRDIYYREPEGYPVSAALGEMAPNGMKWEYYADNRNPYVDFSTFYFTLTRVTFLADTVLVSDKARSVKVRVWSYAAYDMWLRGERVLTEKTPVYQPIEHRDITLELKEGENEILFCVQNFGVRDTRNMISLQILDTEGISVTLNVEEDALAALGECEDWFFRLRSDNKRITAPYPAPFEIKKTVSGNEITLPKGTEQIDCDGEFNVTLTAKVCGTTFKRIFENFEYKPPVFKKRNGEDALIYNAKECLNSTRYLSSSVEDIFKEHSHGSIQLTVSHILLNGGRYDDRAVADIEESLKTVNKRCDCSDFVLSALLTLIKRTDMPKRAYDMVKEAALSFRYWMDEDGADAMCFWSENHALTFYGCQMLAGELFPDDVFLRSGRTGKEQYKVALRRINEWFDVIEEEGFEEFCAGGYMGVTVTAIITVYDFAPDEIKVRAAAAIERILKESAIQCFKGVHIAPMGRIYRGSITPYISSVQALLYLLSDENAYQTLSRASAMAFGSYRLPGGYESMMTDETDTVFTSGRAEIHTRKNDNYMLTSVASPRDTAPECTLDTTTEYYKTKIMNESFHGTSLFTPGGGGYQQHLWYAAISNRFFTFVNLPGTERDFCGMRPGYWYGNLIFPAIKQQGRELWCYYSIPDAVPTKFTHAYFPVYAADEVRCGENYRLARVGDSYIALVCSEPLELWGADSLAEVDLRAYGDEIGWYVKVGSAKEDGSFDSFANSVLDSLPTRGEIAGKFGMK